MVLESRHTGCLLVECCNYDGDTDYDRNSAINVLTALPTRSQRQPRVLILATATTTSIQ